jgi:hypothetical protein
VKKDKPKKTGSTHFHIGTGNVSQKRKKSTVVLKHKRSFKVGILLTKTAILLTISIFDKIVKHCKTM